MMIEALRTPETRFSNLSDFPFGSRYIDDLKGFDGLRMHYVDEGVQNADHVFLCLHGEPTWSYLYRKMIPIFTRAGHRVVAPDYFGFGRSDKPVEEAVHTFEFHRNSLIALIEKLAFDNITLVCQDWGGILGLTLPMALTGKFSRLLIMNTTLGTGDVDLSKGFLAWREWVGKNPNMSPGRLLHLTCPHLTEAECDAYDAPFPDIRFKAGVRRFPEIVPEHFEDPGASLSRSARKWLQEKWSGPVFMAIGMTDPVLGPPVMHALRNVIRNCPEPYELPEAGHFTPEWGEKIARQALEVFS